MGQSPCRGDALRDSMTDVEKPQAAVETIATGRGLSVSIVDLGASIQSIRIPAPGGAIDAVLSYAEPSDYQNDTFGLGATVGPVANRIRNAKFTLNDTLYNLDANDADRGNCQHGGTRGLNRQMFSLHRDKNRPLIRCPFNLSDGYGGFTGNRTFEVIY